MALPNTISNLHHPVLLAVPGSTLKLVGLQLDTFDGSENIVSTIG